MINSTINGIINKYKILLNDFYLLITKHMNGIKMNTNKYAVYGMLHGKGNCNIRGV